MYDKNHAETFPIRELPRNRFPKKLLTIPDCPKELWIQGTMPSEDYVWLAVVGSRKYTTYGRAVVESLIGELRGLPIVIVSGLALGIDALAHQAALKAGLLTIAVPGSGLDRAALHPRANRPLADDICAQGGALLSEYAPDTKPAMWYFPARNRIMAGISDAVLIIEANEQSGTLITARLALDYGRDVYAIPHNIWSDQGRGCNSLLRQGAGLITSANDLKDALGFKTETPIQPELSGLSPIEIQILDLIAEPLSRSDIMQKIPLPAYQIAIALSSLEMSGIIVESLGLIRKKF